LIAYLLFVLHVLSFLQNSYVLCNFTIWYRWGAYVADAILDRMVHTAHRLELKGDSLRKK